MTRFILLLFFAIVIETIFYAYPFTLMIVIMSALTYSAESLIFAFAAGLFLDLFNLKLLGSDSLIFLCITAVILRYNRRINFTSILNILVFVVLSVAVYSFLIYQKFFNIWNILLTIVFSLVMLFFLPFLIPEAGSRKKLKV